MSTANTSVWGKVNQYLSLIKFSHTVFALPFAFIGFTLAVVYDQQHFEWHLLIKMLLCMVFARTAAMSFNRYLDRSFDAANPRTANREIPAGVIKPEHALWFTIFNSVAFVVTTLFINRTVFLLSLVALFVILFYSYTKRVTALCHLVLGVGLALSPLGAYMAVTGYFSWLPVLFSLAVFTWVAGFDIIYALQDEEFDRSHHLHSIPAALGKRRALLVSDALHVLAGLFIIAAGVVGQFHWLYWVGATIYIGLLIYQHMLVSPNDLSRVNMAFANTNGLASILFAVFTILSLLI
jgi:putative 4-hydroxybenzoate polyprenyltransferase